MLAGALGSGNGGCSKLEGQSSRLAPRADPTMQEGAGKTADELKSKPATALWLSQSRAERTLPGWEGSREAEQLGKGTCREAGWRPGLKACRRVQGESLK